MRIELVESLAAIGIKRTSAGYAVRVCLVIYFMFNNRGADGMNSARVCYNPHYKLQCECDLSTASRARLPAAHGEHDVPVNRIGTRAND